MREWLDDARALSWQDLRELGCAEWLWLDMEAPGVHLAPTLPAKPSRQLSHAWGWAEDFAVRVRLDPDLDGPAVTILRWGDAKPAAAEQVEVSPWHHQVWPVGNGRANMPAVTGLNAPEVSTLRTLIATVHRVAAGTQESFGVAFLTR